MKKNIKNVIALAVSASMLVAMTGCTDKANEQVVEAADGYASAVASMNYKKFEKCLSEDVDEDTLDLLNMVMSGDYYDDDASAIIDAVKSTITYEIDEESVDASTKEEEGEIDITFTMADLDSVLDDEDNTVDLDTLLDAIEDADTTEVTITVPFVLEDEEWKVSDIEDVEDVYAFAESAAEVVFTPDLTECIDYANWWFDDGDGIYTNTSAIDLQLYFLDGTDTTGVYYSIVYEGTEIYSAEGTDAWVYASNTSITAESDGCYPAGSYVITFYDAADNILYTDTATVIYEETATTTAAAATSGSSITVVEGDDFWSLHFYADESCTNEVYSYSADDTAMYMELRTFDYYEAGTTFDCDVYLDGEFLGTLTYENDAAGTTDTAYIAVYYNDGSALGSGTYELDITGYNGSNFATVTVVIE